MFFQLRRFACLFGSELSLAASKALHLNTTSNMSQLAVSNAPSTKSLSLTHEAQYSFCAITYATPVRELYHRCFQPVKPLSGQNSCICRARSAPK